MQNQTDQILWRDGDIPVSTRFNDPFFSLENGLAETEHVFLAGNNLPDRFAPDFQIAELGFGTGLNLLVAWDAWTCADQSGPLHFTSFEAFPMHPDDMARAHATFPTFAGKRDALGACWTQNGGVFDLPGLRLEVVVGDARDTLPGWDGAANAWFLDGFAPAKNPELWADDLMGQVGTHTRPDGTFATYTAAGSVRRALDHAGFDVTRIAGYGRKRHMSIGKMRP